MLGLPPHGHVAPATRPRSRQGGPRCRAGRAAGRAAPSSSTQQRAALPTYSQHEKRREADQQQPSSCGRRGSLLAALALLCGAARPAHAAATTSDPVEGTARVAQIGLDSLRVWVDTLSNDETTGLLDSLDSSSVAQAQQRRFAISIPGLSSYSFIHGTLVGGALILLLAADKFLPSQQQQQQQAQQQAHALIEQPLNPEVEVALRRLLASPETKQQFHNRAVHDALDEVRRNPQALANYRDDPVVMQAFAKLLEIENLLERL